METTISGNPEKSVEAGSTTEFTTFASGMTRRNFMLLMQLACVASGVAPAAAQMVTGSGMKGFDDVFGVHSGRRLYDYTPVLTASNEPGNIFYHGQKPRLTFQLQNHLKHPIVCQGRVDIIAYGMHGIPGNIWKPQVVNLGHVGAISISVNMAANGFQNIVITPDIPETNGGYSLVVDLGKHGRRTLTSLIRTFRLDRLPRTQYPQQSLDNVTPPVLERLGIQAIRYDIGYLWSGANGYAGQLHQIEENLRLMHKHKVTCLLEIGAGTAPQPLGMPRPHLNNEAIWEGGKCDLVWLPEYDEDYKHFVYYLASRYGWPKGPITAFGLWNEPWEGLSISGWQSDIPRYRELYTLMGDAVFEAREKAGVQVLVGGACSSTNAWDKFFSEGLENSPLWPKYFDFCSIHYQGLNSPALYRQWHDRQFYQGRVKIWDTESWVANTDDRVAGVLASNRAAGYDRSMGIYYGDVIGGVNWGQLQTTVIRTEKGNKRIQAPAFAWSTAAALCAVQHFLGERKFKEILFERGLPWVYIFDGLNGNKEDGSVVVLGDLSVMNGDNPDQLLFRTVRSTHEVLAKEEIRRQLAALPTSAVAERTKLAEKLHQSMPMVDAQMKLKADGDRFALYDYYGNPVPASNGWITIPLDTRGFFLRGNGQTGSFAAMVDALHHSRITGLEPLEMIPHDFTAPIETRPAMQVVLTNVLPQPVSGVLQADLRGLQIDYPRNITFAAHEQKTIVLRVTGGQANPANLYPLTLKFDAGENGLAVQYDQMRVNWISRKTIKINGDLSDWEGVLPQTIRATGAAEESLTQAAWLPMEAFNSGQTGGLATIYLAYDEKYFYFAAKVAGDQPDDGTLRFADLDKHADEFFYPEESHRVKTHQSLKMREKIQPANPGDIWALQRPDGTGRINGQWVDDPQIEALAFGIDFDIPEDHPQQVAIYIPPGNFAEQGQRLELLDMPSGKLINQQSLHALYNGVYAVYTLRGHKRIRVRAAGYWFDARIGGIFFDPAVAEAKSRFVRFDYETHGNWKGKYGTSGYNVIGIPPHYPANVRVTTPQHLDMQSLKWPRGVRRFTYRKWPVVPVGYGLGPVLHDDIQIAFNAVPYARKKQWITNLPGRMPRFIWFEDTDYEYALNRVAEKYGGGTEIWRMLVPGMPPKNFYPRQPKSPFDGAVADGKLAIRYVNGMRIVECALPWSEIPDVAKLMRAGDPVKFTCRVNKNTGGPDMELAMHRAVSRVNTPALHVQWAHHWANELAFGWEK